MRAVVKIINGEASVSLPDEVVERLGLFDGLEVSLVDSKVGVEIVVNSETARQLAIARDVMKRKYDALRRLAE